MTDRDEVLKMARQATKRDGLPALDRIYLWRENGEDLAWLEAFARMIESRVVEQTLDRVSADLEREELLATSSYTAGLKRAGYVVNQLRPAIREFNNEGEKG